jgi:hypothetical protein
MEKQETLQLISELCSETENAIREHPAGTLDVYTKGHETFARGLQEMKEHSWSSDLFEILNEDEIALVCRYMFASSFIAAYHGLWGNKASRDKAAQSFSTLIWGLGPDPLQTMEAHIAHEQFWTALMKKEGLAQGRGCSSAAAQLMVIAAILIIPILVYTFT